MASIRELRGRIKSVGNIKQITRAMEMVATTKLRRFQERALSSRPYAEEIAALVTHLADVLGDDVDERPLFKQGAGTKVAMLVVSSDRGLCGAYNSSLFKVFEEWRRDNPEAELDLFVYGRKAYQYLSRREHSIERYFHEPELEKIDYRGAVSVSKTLVDAFLTGDYAEVRILYTSFESMVRYTPAVVPFLPVQAMHDGDEEASSSADMILEPDAPTIFDSLVPRYLETRIYNALLEALTSEYASRRVSMKNATDAATDMQGVLKGIYNRKRQETITKELLDIVGGAEALR